MKQLFHNLPFDSLISKKYVKNLHLRQIICTFAVPKGANFHTEAVKSLIVRGLRARLVCIRASEVTG